MEMKTNEKKKSNRSEPAPVFHVDNKQLVEAILQLSVYEHPVTAQLPPGPACAVSSLFWRGCVILVLIGAFNAPIAVRAWDQVIILIDNFSLFDSF